MIKLASANKNTTNDSTEDITLQKQPKRRLSAFTSKHVRTALGVAFVALVCTAIITDIKNNDTPSQSSDYLYTSSLDGTNTKILGEATLVDSTDGNLSAVSDTTQNEQDIYFSQAFADRARKRDEALQTLQTVIDSSETMPDVKDKAYSEMMSIADDMENESNVETLVKAKGFEDCLAVISGENINIVVKTTGLLTNEVAQIKEIAMLETGLSAEHIKIIEKN